MATLPTPEESARRILSIFALNTLNNSRPDDVLMAEQANFAFRQAGGSAAEFHEYAVQNGWLEISNNDTIKLTNAGFAEIKPDKNSN